MYRKCSRSSVVDTKKDNSASVAKAKALREVSETGFNHHRASRERLGRDTTNAVVAPIADRARRVAASGGSSTIRESCPRKRINPLHTQSQSEEWIVRHDCRRLRNFGQLLRGLTDDLHDKGLHEISNATVREEYPSVSLAGEGSCMVELAPTEQTIRRYPRGKGCGLDGIPYDVLQMTPEAFSKALRPSYETVFTSLK